MTSTEKPPLLPVYLFAGSDTLKRESLLKRLMKRVEEECDLSLNAQTFDAAQMKEATDIIYACNTMPFASPMRLVTVRNLHKAPKQIIEELISYLEEPSLTTVLVLEAEKLASNARILSAVKKVDTKAFVDCAEKKQSELPALVQNMARSYGVEMTRDAASKLIELKGTSTIALDNEIEKIVAFVAALGRTSISRSDVTSVVARSAERNPWDLVDAFASRNRGRALELFNEHTDDSPIDLLRLCVMRIRELITVKALQERGLSSENAIAAEMGRPDWQIRRLMQPARMYSSAELRALLEKAADLDMKMKSGADTSLLFSRFLLEV